MLDDALNTTDSSAETNNATSYLGSSSASHGEGGTTGSGDCCNASGNNCDNNDTGKKAEADSACRAMR